MLRLAVIALVIFSLAFIYYHNSSVQYHQMQDELQQLKKEIEELRAQNERLSKWIESFKNDPHLLEKAAREDLDMVKEGEIIIKFDTEAK